MIMDASPSVIDSSRESYCSFVSSYRLYDIPPPYSPKYLSLSSSFQAFQPWIPWIALGLLVFIGVRMILEGIRPKEEKTSLKGGALFMQGVATSIDALSVGFAIAEYTPALAVIESVIIGIVTFGICLAGVRLGGKIGTKLSGKAPILGGIILIGIGIEIFVTGVF